MPNRPATQHRSVRVPGTRWEIFDAKTQAAGTNRAEAINGFIAWYNGEPDARLPTPAPGPEPAESIPTAGTVRFGDRSG